MKRPRIFYGWRIVFAGMGIAMLADALYFYGFSAFFIPWRSTFGWSRALLGGVLGLSRLEGGLVAPVAGWFIDRYGPRRMMFLGIGMMSLGFIALSRINSLVMLYVIFIGLLSIGASFGIFRPLQVAVANWFVRYRGRAMGLLWTGPGLGGSVVFLFAIFINTFGWRAGAVLAGVLLLLLGLPLASVIRHKPEQMGLFPDGAKVSPEIRMATAARVEGSPVVNSQTSAGQVEGDPASLGLSKARHLWMRDPRPEIDLTTWQALRTQAFWMMAITYAMWTAMPAIVTVHIAPFLAEELELKYVTALSALSFFAFASLFGRIGFGLTSDYVNIRLLTAILLVMQGLGIFLFSHIHTFSQIPLYVTIFAIPYGGMIPLRSVLQGYFFGRKSFGTIGGLIQFVNLPTTVAAPIWVGWLADVMPNGYRIGFQIIAVSLIVAAFFILLARRPRPPLPADRPPLPQAFRHR